ncbi:VOC family protein [Geodermatophilus sabuli]|uniref:VOC family protein n=1 Tax=Geodermatophilus sabuli TaxID=1564158 RepID=A0A7K3VXK2_9ACTN|nr:VOC family protein [Geodermatophilus sabuli]
MTAPSPRLLGLSHLALSVVDLDAAARFWTTVLGFEPLEPAESVRFLIHRGARLGVVLTDHAGAVTHPFDERRTGLDHLALAVPGEADLRAWERRLDELGVPHSPVTATDAGHHLNLRAPDRFPVELYAMAPSFAAVVGLADPVDAVARTH